MPAIVPEHISADQLQPKRRQPGEERLRTRAVRALLSPYNSKISEWQATAVWLSTAIQHKQNAADRRELRRQASALLMGVKATIRELTDKVADAPPDVAGDTRVLDCLRALDGLRSNLRAMCGRG